MTASLNSHSIKTSGKNGEKMHSVTHVLGYDGDIRSSHHEPQCEGDDIAQIGENLYSQWQMEK